MKTISHPRSGFTLIELLTVIAIIGILAGILIPTIGAVRKKASQVGSTSDLRQIHLAHANYQSDGPRMRSIAEGQWSQTSSNQAATPADFAKVLAWYTELNEAQLFYISSAEDTSQLSEIPNTIFRGFGKERTVDPDFENAKDNISYSMARVSANASASTPLIWTKGLTEDGTWNVDTELSPWGDEGGHIIFVGGNVEFFQQIEEGDLRKPDGTPTAAIQEAFTRVNRILESN